jgi:outer membrane receptor protein involved in Fe transport
VPGTETVQTRNVGFATARTRHQVSLDDRLPLSWPLHLEAAVRRERIDDHFDNRDGEVGLARVDTENQTVDTGWRGALSAVIPPLHQEPRVTIDRRTEGWTPYDRLRQSRGFTRAREHQTVSLEDRLTLGRLIAEASYLKARAVDNYAGSIGWGRPAEASAPRQQSYEGPTFGVRLDCGGGFLVKANRGRLARFPTFPELFGQNGVQEGNPALRPEHGVQWDAGLQFAPSRPFRVEAAYFESLVEDQVVLLQNSQRTVKAMNLERAWVRGVESSGFTRIDLTGKSALEVQGSYTWQEARDVGRSATYRGKELPNLPGREGFGSLRLLNGPWDGRWEVSARSSHYRDRYNSPQKRTPASAVHDASLGRTWRRESFHARFEVHNLFDRRTEDIDGFPLPGRSFLAEITYSLASGTNAAAPVKEQ